jgi:hypothetical protein
MKTFHKFTLLFLFLSIFNATLSCSSNDKTLPQPIPDIEEEEEETKDVVLPEDSDYTVRRKSQRIPARI